MAIQPIRIVISGIDKFSSTIAQSQKRIEKFASSIGNVGKKMTVGLSLPIAAMGITSIQTASTFEDSMNRVSAVTGATEQQIASLSKMALDMGSNTIFSANVSADAMKLMGDAGFKAEEILSGLPSVLKLSSIANLEMAEAVNVADDILEGYGKTIGDLPNIVNQFATAAKLGGIGVGQISAAMTSLSPTAQALGIGLEETMTVVSRFGNLGIDVGRATMALRTGMASLAKPGREAIKVFEKLNIRRMDVFDDKGKLKSLIGLMELLKSRGATSTDLIQLFSTRAGPVMATMLEKGMGGIRDLEQSIKSYGNTADVLMKKQEASFSGKMKKFQAVFQNLQISIGNVLLPVIIPLLDKLSKVFAWIESMSPATKKMIVVFAGLVAAIGPLLVIFGTVLSSIVSISGAIASAGGIIALLSNPIGWVVAAILALIGLITYMATHLQSKSAGILALFTPMGAIVAWIIARWSRLLPFFKLALLTLGFLFKKFYQFVKPILDPLINLLSFLGGLIFDVLDKALSGLERLANLTLPDWVKQKIGLMAGAGTAGMGTAGAGALVDRAGNVVAKNESTTNIKIENRANASVRTETAGSQAVNMEVDRGILFQGAF